MIRSLVGRVRLALLLCVPILAGCGGGSGPTLHPVKGKVLLGGKAIAVKEGENALVQYHPDQAAGNKETVIAVGPVAADGSYELSTNGKPGAPAGKWVVTVVYQTGPGPDAKDAAAYAVPKNLINETFNAVISSPLKKEVTPAGGNYDLTVTK